MNKLTHGVLAGSELTLTLYNTAFNLVWPMLL